MPSGIETFVDGGFATVDFVDPALKGPALTRLVDIGGPESVETITRDGPRRKYRVPEGNARAAGLVDSPVAVPRRKDQHWAADLAAADPIADGGQFRPDVPTVKGANDAGPVSQADVATGQSVITTESTNPAPITAVAPAHVAVQKAVKKAAPKPRPAAKRRAGKSGAPTLAGQKAALASDPQSRPEVTAAAAGTGDVLTPPIT